MAALFGTSIGFTNIPGVENFILNDFIGDDPRDATWNTLTKQGNHPLDLKKRNECIAILFFGQSDMSELKARIWSTLSVQNKEQRRGVIFGACNIEVTRVQPLFSLPGFCTSFGEDDPYKKFCDITFPVIILYTNKKPIGFIDDPGDNWSVKGVQKKFDGTPGPCMAIFSGDPKKRPPMIKDKPREGGEPEYTPAANESIVTAPGSPTNFKIINKSTETGNKAFNQEYEKTYGQGFKNKQQEIEFERKLKENAKKYSQIGKEPPKTSPPVGNSARVIPNG